MATRVSDKITSVPVVEFVFVTVCKILRVGLLVSGKSQLHPGPSENFEYLDFFIRHPVTHAGIQFI